MSDLDPAMMQLARQIAREAMTELANNPQIAKRFLSGAEAAAYLGLEPRAMETMRREKRGPRYLKPTERLVRYKVSDLDAYLEAHAVEPGAGK